MRDTSGRQAQSRNQCLDQVLETFLIKSDSWQTSFVVRNRKHDLLIILDPAKPKELPHELNTTDPTDKFMIELEDDNLLRFRYVGLCRSENYTERNIFLKYTCLEEYAHFLRIVVLKRRRNSTSHLVHRAKKSTIQRQSAKSWSIHGKCWTSMGIRLGLFADVPTTNL